MMNPRESIEYHNRKFKMVFTGTDADAGWIFHLDQPPNEFAYSDRYSQCLIQIRRAHLSNRGDTVNHGLDSQFESAGGVELCASGVMLTTDIRCNNRRHYYVDTADATDHGVFCMLTSKFGSSGVGGNFGGIPTNCCALAARGQAAGGAGLQGANENLHLVNAWEYEDTRPIEDAGVLCGNPFGKKFECRLKSVDTGERVTLTSEANFNAAASAGSSLILELDVLMLPNPTPEDK